MLEASQLKQGGRGATAQAVWPQVTHVTQETGQHKRSGLVCVDG